MLHNILFQVMQTPGGFLEVKFYFWRSILSEDYRKG